MSNVLSDLPVLQAKGLAKTYQDGHFQTTVLEDISLSLMAQQAVAIMGSSGSGKSTLLHLLGGLDRFNAGDVLWQARTGTLTNIQSLSDRQLSKVRADYLGFVYQFHHLLPEFSLLENLLIPQRIAGKVSPKVMLEKAVYLLDKVGLGHRLHHKPSEVSGGERQRTAIARALVNDPAILLADEPTGNLDESNAHQVMGLLMQLQQETDMAILMVTHEPAMAAYLHDSWSLQQGVLLRSSS